MGLNITRIGQREWFLDVRVRRAGKEYRKRETFYGTKVEAEEKFFLLKRDLKGGREAGPTPLNQVETFGEALALYQEEKEGLKQKERGRFERLYRDLGHVPIPELPNRLDQYLKHVKATPSKKTRKAIASGTINRLVNLTKAALNMAVRKERLERNPITVGRFPRLKEVPRDKVLTEEEVDRLHAVIRKEASHLEAIVRFALQVPCRRSELVRMQISELDLVNHAIRVRNGTTKNDQGCWKPIPPDMTAYFRSIPPECPWVFYRVRKGRFLPLGDFKKAWGRCKRLAGIEDFRFHDTRHVSATALLDNGTPEQVVMTVAGWKTNMLRTYYHRAGKQALALVKFPSGSGHSVDASGMLKAKIALIS